MSWSDRLKNGTGDRLKSWAAVLMGLAALITALNTYQKPDDNEKKVEAAYTKLATEIEEMSKDINALTNDVHYLYSLRAQEAADAKTNAELNRTQQKVDDMKLKAELTKRYGAHYARKFLERQEKFRKELQPSKRAPKKPSTGTVPKVRMLPPLREVVSEKDKEE